MTRGCTPNWAACHLPASDLEMQPYTTGRPLALDATFAEAHHGLGLALHEQGLLEEAEGSYREAIRIDPALAAPWVALARLQAERGDWDESCQTARQILALRPNVADAYWRLAINLKGALPDRDIEAMQSLLEHKYVSHSLRAGLHFALGAVFDARGMHGQAAEHFDAANGLQTAVMAAKGQSFDPNHYSRMIDRVIAAFSPALLARGRGWGDPDPRPVFVVGLPRSGTTLVEQVLASHSQVHGAGELHDAINLFSALPELVGQPGGDPFEVVGCPWPRFGSSGGPQVSRKARSCWHRPRRGASWTRCPTTSICWG